jgi:DNA invertase Pin-like site-specific DNA recombinase
MNKNRNCPFPVGSLVYAYLRHSPGDNQTIASQDAAVRAWCAENGLQIGRVFKDEAKSGTSTAGRDEFLMMIDFLRDTNLKPRPVGVVLWSFSRFARDINDAEYYKADLRRRHYIVYSLTDQVPDGDIAPVFESLIHWKDAERSREISRDARRGLRWLAEQGYSIGGFPPRGYRKSASVEVGHKKNGEPRLAYKWEIDPEWEARVRQAWQLRLGGASYYEIHHATRLFTAINSYPTFFSNVTYAGCRKCDDLVVENAHPAYVTKAEFELAQSVRRVTRGNPKAPNGDPNHSRRRDSPFLLSGILYCTCGAAMLGDRDNGKPFYRCGRQRRSGHLDCHEPSIVAWYLHDFVSNWLVQNVLTLDYLIQSRDEINRRLSERRGELDLKRVQLEKEANRLDKEARRLVDAIARLGLSSELEQGIQERQIAIRQVQTEMVQIDFALKQQSLEISNEALLYLAENMKDMLQSGHNEKVREVLRGTVARAELAKEKLTLHYFPPVLQGQLIPGFKRVPPWECLSKTIFTYYPTYGLSSRIRETKGERKTCPRCVMFN